MSLLSQWQLLAGVFECFNKNVLDEWNIAFEHYQRAMKEVWKMYDTTPS